MLDRSPPAPPARPPLSPGAARARRARARHRAGLTVYAVAAHEHQLAEALVRAGRLTDGEALERAKVEKELSRLVDDWANRWLA